MSLKENGPIKPVAQDSDTISCVFLPQKVGANSVHLRHETKTLKDSLKATTKKPPTLENKNAPILRSQNT